MNKKTIVAVIVLLTAFMGAVIWASMPKPEEKINVDEINATLLQTTGTDSVEPWHDQARRVEAPHQVVSEELNGGIGDHVRGKIDAKVVVVEYADMMCGGCAGASFTIKGVYEKYKDRVAFVYRHFPMDYHPNAKSAAAALEAASQQGFFWEMLDELYANRDPWLEETGPARTNAYAAAFKRVSPSGDEQAFRDFLHGEGVKKAEKKIAYDTELARKQGAPGTPTFFVNGKMLNMEEVKTQMDIARLLQKMIDEELAKTTAEK